MRMYSPLVGICVLILACSTTTRRPKQGGAGTAVVDQAGVADSVFSGVQLGSPRFDQDVDNNMIVVAGIAKPSRDTTLAFVLPATKAMYAETYGDSISWVFRASDGSVVVPGAPTNSANYTKSAPGDLPGFVLRNPATGQWHVDVKAAGRSAAAYMLVVSVDDQPFLAHLEVMARSDLPRVSNSARPGDIVFVRAFMTDKARPVAGISWAVSATRPDTGQIVISVHDDGRHLDGAAGDGVYVGAFRPEKSGAYVVSATGHAPGGAQYIVHDAVVVDKDPLQDNR
jgi:hypothetical protein